MSFEVLLLGTGAATPSRDRHPAAVVIKYDEQWFLVDCGEGTQMQMAKYQVAGNKIRQIFISHLHGDHVFGLIGLVSSMGLFGRTQPLEIFAPEGLRELIETQQRLTRSYGLPFSIHFHVLDTTRAYCCFENKALRVFTIPLDHRIPTTGFLFEEKPRLRNILPEMITAYGLDFDQIKRAKAGEDILLSDGSLIANETLTKTPPPPRSFAYCSDTAYYPPIVEYIKGVNLLYHESTFCEQHSAEATASKHSTAKQAAAIARDAEVQRLVLGHFSPRYADIHEFEQEAQSIFANSTSGKEGVWYDIG